MLTTPKQLILLVEDCPEDFEMTVRSLKKAGLSNPVHHCENGDEALAYLRQESEKGAPSNMPGIILLDLNMPGTDGREILEEIKQDPEWKKIPVIVLTTSKDERDVQDCYRRGANSYIQKPLDLDGFIKAMTRLKDYWFEVVVLPKPIEAI